MFCGVNGYRLKRETRAGLVEIALRDMTSPVCGICDGAGELLSGRYEMAHGAPGIRAVMVECPSCNGCGRHRLSLRAMAELCGIAHNSWGLSHKAVLAEATRLLAGLDGEVWAGQIGLRP